MQGAHLAMFLFIYLSLREKESPLLFFFSPQKAKNDDKVTFLERISEKYLVTFGNFFNFAVDFIYIKNVRVCVRL